MRLMDLPRTTSGIPVKVVGDDTEQIFIFFHPDGMYSYCHTETGELYHLNIMTEVELATSTNSLIMELLNIEDA